MKAGASTRILRFPEGFFPTEGFSRQLDPLCARVLVLENGARYALLVLELTSIPPEEIDALNAVLAAATGAAHCFVLAAHTFSAPHFMPDERLDGAGLAKKRQLQALVAGAVREAAQEAVQQLCEVYPSVGAQECLVNSARDVQTPAGWWIGCCGDGPVDHAMTVIDLRRADSTHAAVLVHYPVQSSVLDGSQLREGGKAVSGDLAGAMAAELEAETGCPVLFLIGAAGDQAPRQKAVGFTCDAQGALTPTDMQDDAVPLCRTLAREMVQAARAALRGATTMRSSDIAFAQRTVTVPAKEIERDLHRLHPTRIPPYVPCGESGQSVTLLAIGDVRLIGVKPELCCVTARQIGAGDPLVRVVTLWNGGAKYMADAASCDRITYESQNSPFMKGAAELLAACAREMLE